MSEIETGGASTGATALFTDARTCREWLNALPLANIPGAQVKALEAMRELNASAAFAPLERLKCLELMRDKVAFLQGEQRARYFGKTLPLSPADASSWATGRNLLQALEAGYRQCLAACPTNAEVGAHAVLIEQRIMRYLGAQMLFHASVYRRFEPELWTRAHELYQQVEADGTAEERVKDSVEGEDGVSSVAESYIQLVLMQAAYLSELTAPEMDFVGALTRMWTKKIRILREVPEGAEGILPFAVDLARPLGARPLAVADKQDSHRIFDVTELAKSVRRRIHALKNDEDPATLGLPPEASALDCLHQLTRLSRLWCEGAPPRPPAKVPPEKQVGLIFGFTEIHFFLSAGKAFEQPDKKRELSAREKDDIAMFGRVREATQSAMKVEVSYTVEKWGVVDEMLGAWRLLRPANAAKGVTIGRVVAMRLADTAPFLLGMVSALAQETDGKVIITVQLFPGRPEPIAVRAADARVRASAQWVQGFKLPALERMKVPESIVVPAAMAQRGRGVEVWIGRAREKTVEEVLEHGSDFDRITVF
jgi:hypothetical protein